MAGKAGLKAGLIGGAIMLVLALLGLIPVPLLNVCCCGVQLLAYAGIGILAGFFLTPPRTAGTGAGAGAIAGVVSGVVAGVVGMLIAAIRMAIAGPAGQIVSAIDPETMRQLAELGIDITPRMLATFSGWGGVAVGGSLCCLGWLVIGAALGAVGGAIFAATKSED